MGAKFHRLWAVGEEILYQGAGGGGRCKTRGLLIRMSGMIVLKAEL